MTMSATSCLSFPRDAATTARDLYQLLVDLQDARARRVAHTQPYAAQWTERMRQLAERSRRLANAFAQSNPKTADALAHVGQRVERMRQNLAEGKPVPNLTLTRASQQYEALAKLVRQQEWGRDEGVDLPILKPRNYARNIFHVANGLIGAAIYTVIPERSTVLRIALIYFSVMAVLEITRRFSRRWNAILVDKVFGSIARPVEAHRVNAGSWYGLAMVLIVFSFSPAACVAAVLVLGVGDPAAALIGKRWGKHKLRGQKTLEGAIGFAVSATIATTAFLVLTQQPAVQRGDTVHTFGFALLVSVVTSVVGAVVEVLSDRIEDNLSIPVMCAAVASLLV